jgi:hypothetical protein
MIAVWSTRGVSVEQTAILVTLGMASHRAVRMVD